MSADDGRYSLIYHDTLYYRIAQTMYKSAHSDTIYHQLLSNLVVLQCC